jgi:hypothetical protein
MVLGGIEHQYRLMRRDMGEHGCNSSMWREMEGKASGRGYVFIDLPEGAVLRIGGRKSSC